jgi:hypothetical protein
MFQFGSFYNQTNDLLNLLGAILGALLGAAISGWIAVRIFNKGIIKQNENEYIRKIERLTFCQKTYKKQLENILNYLVLQIYEFDKYIDITHKFPYNISTPIEIPNHELGRVLKTDSIALTELFEYLKLPNEDYVRTISTLDYLYSVSKQWPKDLINLQNGHIFNMIDTLYIKRREIISEISDYIIIEEQKAEPSDFSKFSSNLLFEYGKDASMIGDLSYDYEKFFNPLHMKLFGDFKMDTFHFQLLKRVKDPIDILYTIKLENVKITESIVRLKEKYYASSEDLKVIIEKLK